MMVVEVFRFRKVDFVEVSLLRSPKALKKLLLKPNFKNVTYLVDNFTKVKVYQVLEVPL
jgi:hypothetical protein